MQSEVAAANTTAGNSPVMSWFQIILRPTTYAIVPNAVASTIGIKCRVSDAMGCSTLASTNGKDQRLATHGPAIIHDDARESFASCG